MSIIFIKLLTVGLLCGTIQIKEEIFQKQKLKNENLGDAYE